MNIRGIVESKFGSRIFIRPADCTCDECPRADLTQRQLQTDIDAVNVGDKVESYTGALWYRVDEFTPNEQLDSMNEVADAMRALMAGTDLDSVEEVAEQIARRTNIKSKRHLN